MLGIWPWEPWDSLFCLYSFHLSASIFLFSNGIIPSSLCLFARYFCSKIFLFFCYLNSFLSRHNSLPTYILPMYLNHIIVVCTHIFLSMSQALCWSEQKTDRTHWWLSGCQTCRCDLDHHWGVEVVINPAIMPWKLY